jgi:hypothetical protein
MAKSSAERRSVHIHKDVHALLPADHGDKGAYAEAAIREKNDRDRGGGRLGFGASLHFPDSAQEAAIDEQLQDAEVSIDLVGFTLASVPTAQGATLRAKLAQGVRVSFITINPNIDREHPLYKVMEKVLAPNLFLPQVKASTKFFLELRKDYEHLVSVRVCDEMPAYGLTMTDELGARPRMRVLLYKTYRTFAPFIDIERAEGGETAFNSFQTYYKSLSERSVPL